MTTGQTTGKGSGLDLHHKASSSDCLVCIMHAGTWFVLFTSSHEPSLQHLGQAWEELGASQLAEPQQVIFAAVDVADEPDLAERFGITSLPTFLLFRDRQVRVNSASRSSILAVLLHAFEATM